MRATAVSFRVLLFGLAAIAVLGAALSVPSEREKLALQERDGEVSIALQRVERRLSDGNQDVHLFDAAVRLHLQLGNLEAAAAAAEQHAAAVPDDLASQMRLLDLLRDRGQHERYLVLARRVYDRWRDPQLLRELLQAYRLRQSLEVEVRLLRLSVGLGQATAADIERLGMIEAARGDHEAAIELLRDGDAMRDGIDRSSRITLFELLVERDLSEEAMRLAGKWLLQQPDHGAAAQFCVALAFAGRLDLAAAVTQHAEPRDADEAYLACVERVIGAHDTGLAATLLDRWFGEKRVADAALIDRFTRAALKIDRIDLALAAQSAALSYALPATACRNSAPGALQSAGGTDPPPCRGERNGD